MINKKKIIVCTLSALMLNLLTTVCPCKTYAGDTAVADDETVVLRVCNWEEYIDEGGWDEESAIELDSQVIYGENSMVDDFTKWYHDTYGINVEVEYSTFGTNEDLFNQLNLGDTYDLVCPSEYMIMKLLVNDKLEPYDEDFFDETNEHNYYIKGVSPYIRKTFEENEIDGEKWSKYAAGFMWGTTGIVYNPDEVTHEEASTWKILQNRKFNRKVTIKDNVRDAYFAAVGIYKEDILMNKNFRDDKDYHKKLMDEMNDTSKDTIDDVERILKDIKNNVYSFETDAGKSDMVTGKIVANYQWSGDAVYALDQAEEDEFYLCYAVPVESTNLWFDGWVMLSDGIDNDKAKKHAAQAFVNFLSRPDNVVRNMNYIGYTSAISGGEDPTVFEYANWLYAAEEDDEDTIEYDVSYFFGDDKEYIITANESQSNRQLFAQYPTQEVINRSSIMCYFDDEATVNINKMWINVRCFTLSQLSFAQKIVLVFVAVAAIAIIVRKKIKKI